jgi:hypothetical protein
MLSHDVDHPYETPLFPGHRDTTTERWTLPDDVVSMQ